MEGVSALRVKAACVGCAVLSLDSLIVLLFLSSSFHFSLFLIYTLFRSGKLSRFVLYLASTRLIPLLNMAEYLGAVASAVQLVDVALRASREAYGFLSAVKSAKEDVRELREGWSRL
jgi:hypothetical protein